MTTLRGQKKTAQIQKQQQMLGCMQHKGRYQWKLHKYMILLYITSCKNKRSQIYACNCGSGFIWSNEKSCKLWIPSIVIPTWYLCGSDTTRILFELTTVVQTNKAMRGQYMCLNTNLHDQTSHFHLYVNAEIVKSYAAVEEEVAVGLGLIIWTPFGPVIWQMPHLMYFPTNQLSRYDNSQVIGKICSFLSFTQAGSRFQDCDLIGWKWGQAEQMLSNKAEIEVTCFLTYLLISLCSDAAFTRSNFNLVLENSINLWRCLQYKEDKNAEQCGKHWCHILCPHTTLPRPKCRTC